MRREREQVEQPHTTGEADVEFYVTGSYRTSIKVGSQRDVDITVAITPRDGRLSTKEAFRALAKQLCEEHPAIDMNKEILGGIPRVKGTRLSVGQLIGRVNALRSIDAVIEYYHPRITEEQIKEALAFAQDFVELACEPLQAND